MSKLKLFYIEKRGDQYLVMLNRGDGRTVAGITAVGNVVTVPGATDNLTDNEWRELLSISKDNVTDYDQRFWTD